MLRLSLKSLHLRLKCDSSPSPQRCNRSSSSARSVLRLQTYIMQSCQSSNKRKQIEGKPPAAERGGSVIMRASCKGSRLDSVLHWPELCKSIAVCFTVRQPSYVAQCIPWRLWYYNVHVHLLYHSVCHSVHVCIIVIWSINLHDNVHECLSCIPSHKNAKAALVLTWTL